MNESQTQEYINTLLLDIERKTNIGEFNLEHEKKLSHLLNEFDNSWSEAIFEFLIDSPICDTYPKVMNQLIEKMNPYFFNNETIEHILSNKYELKHVAFLEKIYEKTKQNYNQNLTKNIESKIQELFFDNFQDNTSNVDDCVNFFLNQKIVPNYGYYQYRIAFCFCHTPEEFKSNLENITEKFIKLDKQFFLTYLNSYKDVISYDMAGLAEFLPILEQAIEKYSIQKESLNLDLALNNKVKQNKKIKM